MAQSQSLIQDGIDRFETTFRSFERDWKRLQKRADKRRKELEKRAEKEVRRLQTRLRRSPVVQRAGSFGTDARKRFEGQVDSLLGSLRIASQADVAKLERKLNALNRKIRALESEAA